jgi:hypothetical protein
VILNDNFSCNYTCCCTSSLFCQTVFIRNYWNMTLRFRAGITQSLYWTTGVLFPAGQDANKANVQIDSGLHTAPCLVDTELILSGIKRPGPEADHSPFSRAEVENAWSYTSASLYVCIAWCLVKHQGQLHLLCYLVPTLPISAYSVLCDVLFVLMFNHYR